MKIPMPNNWILTFEAKPRKRTVRAKQNQAGSGEIWKENIFTDYYNSQVKRGEHLMMNRMEMQLPTQNSLVTGNERLRNLCP
jgi:hypothetical protein